MEHRAGQRFKLPEDPTLAAVAAAYRDAGLWCYAVDAQWRLVYLTDDNAEFVADGTLQRFWFAPEVITDRIAGAHRGTIADCRAELALFWPWVLADLDVEPEALRMMLHPDLRDVLDGPPPSMGDALSYLQPSGAFGGIVVSVLAQRVRDPRGRVVGTVFSSKPAVDMTTLFLLAGSADVGHLERTRRLAVAQRRPAAVLFADLEGSAQLARRLPTTTYLTLVRRMTRAADRCVIDAGGIVGRHAGDGVTAFFPAESAGSESAAAAACIKAARALQSSMISIAERHELPAEELVMRAGLHWGATLYIGSIITAGRSEVTALGDEVNEAARIEACATGGRALASKALVERLDPDDAAALGLDPNRVAYTPLADLDTATEKARRDAPAIPVCDVTLAAT